MIIEIMRVAFSWRIFFPQCSVTARENTHRKHPSKMDRQDRNAEMLVCTGPCDAIRAPKTPVHQIMVIGEEMASVYPAIKDLLKILLCRVSGAVVFWKNSRTFIAPK